MSAHAVNDIHVAANTAKPPSVPELAGTRARWSGHDKAETEAPQTEPRSGRLHPLPEREDLEPHWAAAIDAATD